MAAKKGTVLPRMEFLLIASFFLVFAIWAISRCSSKKSAYSKELEREAAVAREDSLRRLGINPQDTAKAYTPTVEMPAPVTAGSGTTNRSILYVTIDGLKVRKSPSLTGDLVEELRLFDEVYFLGEVSNFSEEINLGKAIANEPWVRVQTKKGKAGWVYGAGVHYYKRKNPDAL
ncbi:MAG: SH3 domain-containing protein [Lewinellaceae bacterium]|nr:SH3 domain-containing protein [Lewinellaceae bacterium]